MIKRFGSGYFAVTLDLGRPKYTKKKILEESINGDSHVLKLETEPPNVGWICYSLNQGDKEIAFVRGYYNGNNSFHVQRIKNLLKDRIAGYRYMPQIFNFMEKDLKKQGVEELTSAVYLKIAPIAMRRYGFSSINGENIQDIKKSWWKYIPFAWKPLKKKI